jgi:hypothetical protein
MLACQPANNGKAHMLDRPAVQLRSGREPVVERLQSSRWKANSSVLDAQQHATLLSRVRVY